MAFGEGCPEGGVVLLEQGDAQLGNKRQSSLGRWARGPPLVAVSISPTRRCRTFFFSVELHNKTDEVIGRFRLGTFSEMRGAQVALGQLHYARKE